MTFAAAWAAVQSARKIITLAAVLVSAAAIYVWGESGHRDARSVSAWARLTCSAAGQEFQEGGHKRQWGTSCHAEVQRLGQLERDLQSGSLEALLAEVERRDGKQAADMALATAWARRAAQAAERMEQVDGAVSEDHVDGRWACAVNDLGGMRAPGC